MFRRFSINYAIFSMGIDAIVVMLMLYLSTVIRPSLSSLPFVASFGGPIATPFWLDGTDKRRPSA